MQKIQDLSSYEQPNDTRGRSPFIVLLWWGVQATLFRWSPRPFFRYRCFLLSLFGAEIGRDVKIRSTAEFTYPWKVSVGDYCWIGDYCSFYSLDKITLGSNVALAHGVYISTGSHDTSKSTFDLITAPVLIEDEVWIANDVFIAMGVVIGKGAVLAARSTVWEDVSEGVVVGGYPAKFIRNR